MPTRVKFHALTVKKAGNKGAACGHVWCLVYLLAVCVCVEQHVHRLFRLLNPAN